MLKALKDAAQTVADRLMDAEEAVDLAFAKVAELIAAMPLARLDANIAMEIGHPALEAAVEMLTHLEKARRAMIETHRRLAETKDQIGLREVAFGGLVDKASEQPGLRVVARDVA